MEQAKLGELERAAVQGDRLAGARLLQEQLRRGWVSDAGIELASWLGAPGAAILRPDASAPSDVGLLELVDGLQPWGRWVVTKAAHALSQWLAPSSGPRQGSYRLVWHRPDLAGGVVRCSSAPLEPGVPLMVGRGPEAEVVIDERSVSDRHCEVLLTRKRTLWVRDLESSPGTWVGGHRLRSRPIRVLPGNVLTLGRARVRVRGPAGSLIRAVESWLDDPNRHNARQVAAERQATLPKGGGLDGAPHELAALAAAHAALDLPGLFGCVRPSTYFALCHPFPPVDVARGVLQRALLPFALDAQLPHAPDPPSIRTWQREVWPTGAWPFSLSDELTRRSVSAA